VDDADGTGAGVELALLLSKGFKRMTDWSVPNLRILEVFTEKEITSS
jgi:hypothetical protein